MVPVILTDITKRFRSSQFWLIMFTSIATALGSFGGFPKPPPIFIELAKNIYVQWLLMFILILQGGSRGDIIYAIIATAIVFLLYQAVSMITVAVEKTQRQNQHVQQTSPAPPIQPQLSPHSNQLSEEQFNPNMQSEQVQAEYFQGQMPEQKMEQFNPGYQAPEFGAQY